MIEAKKQIYEDETFWKAELEKAGYPGPFNYIYFRKNAELSPTSGYKEIAGNEKIGGHIVDVYVKHGIEKNGQKWVAAYVDIKE